MIDSIKTIESLFPTIIYRSCDNNFPLLRDQIITDIYKIKEYDGGGVIKSNEGGWQSSSDLEQDLFKKHNQYVKDRIHDTLPIQITDRYSIQSVWAAVNGPGDFNWPHFHTEALLSGVMWIKISPTSGSIRFENPNEYIESPNILRYTEEMQIESKNILAMQYTPREGEMMIFPAWLKHAVTPNRSTTDRISLAFNLV
jgi:uncharacterized protein (TIGR02466 family)